MLITPRPLVSLVGLVLLAAVWGAQVWRRKRGADAGPEAATPAENRAR